MTRCIVYEMEGVEPDRSKTTWKEVVDKDSIFHFSKEDAVPIICSK